LLPDAITAHLSQRSCWRRPRLYDDDVFHRSDQNCCHHCNK